MVVDRMARRKRGDAMVVGDRRVLRTAFGRRVPHIRPAVDRTVLESLDRMVLGSLDRTLLAERIDLPVRMDSSWHVLQPPAHVRGRYLGQQEMEEATPWSMPLVAK